MPVCLFLMCIFRWWGPWWKGRIDYISTNCERVAVRFSWRKLEGPYPELQDPMRRTQIMAIGMLIPLPPLPMRTIDRN